MSTSRNRWDLDQEAFDELLAWLNPDRERAGLKYENIRERLIRIFAHRGCISAEDLADSTINKVARKVPELKTYYVGDPALYFCGVARNVYRDYVKVVPDLPVNSEILATPVPDDSVDEEPEEKCVESCLASMATKDRELLLEYYRYEGGAKIDLHKEMARRRQISVNALRIVMCRLRASFKKCMENCLRIESA